MPVTGREAAGQDLFERYLLGELSGEEQERAEEAYFGDDATLGQLLAAEEGLIENYLAGRLSGERLSRFERCYLTTPEKRRRVEVVRELRVRASAPAPRAEAEAKAPRWQSVLDALFPRSPPGRFALALGLLLLTLGPVALLSYTLGRRSGLGGAEGRTAELRRQVDDARRELDAERGKREELARSLGDESEQRRVLEDQLSAANPPAAPGPKPTAEAPLVPTLAFSAAESGVAYGKRGGQGAPRLLVLPARARLARLVLNTTAPVAGEIVAGLSRGGEQVWQRSYPAADGPRKALAVYVPARVLAKGPHTLTLSERGPDRELRQVGRYEFTVGTP